MTSKFYATSTRASPGQISDCPKGQANPRSNIPRTCAAIFAVNICSAKTAPRLNQSSMSRHTIMSIKLTRFCKKLHIYFSLLSHRQHFMYISIYIYILMSKYIRIIYIYYLHLCKTNKSYSTITIFKNVLFYLFISPIFCLLFFLRKHTATLK